MLKAKHIAYYDGSLDEELNKFFEENQITKENLISVEYATRVIVANHQQNREDRRWGKKNDTAVLDQLWFASALVIWNEPVYN